MAVFIHHILLAENRSTLDVVTARGAGIFDRTTFGHTGSNPGCLFHSFSRCYSLSFS